MFQGRWSYFRSHCGAGAEAGAEAEAGVGQERPWLCSADAGVQRLTSKPAPPEAGQGLVSGLVSGRTCS